MVVIMALFATFFVVCSVYCFFFFFKQKTAYEMRISDWSSDVCSSDLSWSPRPLNTPGERSYRSSRADWQRPKRNRGNPTDRTHKDGYRHWAMPRWRSHRGVAPLAHRRNENAPVWRNARTKSGRGKPSAILSAHNNGVQTAHRFAPVFRPLRGSA